MSKQTAVDWLFLMLNNPNRDQEFANKLFEKAKEIEKDKLERSYILGSIVGIFAGIAIGWFMFA